MTETRKPTLSLSETIKYSNNELIFYYAEKQNLEISEAEELFVDLKKWLWLCGNLDENSQTVYLFQDHWIVDEFWHHFLLFTKDYLDFCSTYIGRTLYHHPEHHFSRKKQAHRIKTSPSLQLKESLQLLQGNMNEVGRVLGNDTLIRWYKTIPEKYGRQSEERHSG